MGRNLDEAMGEPASSRRTWPEDTAIVASSAHPNASAADAAAHLDGCMRRNLDEAIGEPSSSRRTWPEDSPNSSTIVALASSSECARNQRMGEPSRGEAARGRALADVRCHPSCTPAATGCPASSHHSAHVWAHRAATW